MVTGASLFLDGYAQNRFFVENRFKLMNYQHLREKLTVAPKSEWDSLVERAVDEGGSLKDQVRGRIQGCSFSDVSMDEDCIEATVELLVLGDIVSDEDGPYQDEDGDSYDYEEEELTFYVTITDSGFAWEKG